MKKLFILVFFVILTLTCHSCKKDLSVHMNESIENTPYKKVILLTGQSNATGISHNEYLEKNCDISTYEQYKNGFNNVLIMYKADGNTSSEFVNVKLGQGNNENLFGPEIGIAETLNKFNPNETYYIIKCTFSGTALATQWLNNGERFELYNKFIDYVKNIMDSLGSDYKIFACCFMQGESDGAISLHKEYKSNLEKFVSYLRSDLSSYKVDEDIYFIDAGIASNWNHYKAINKAKIDFACGSSKNAYIDTIYHGLDNNKEPIGEVDRAHYDALSEIKLGNLFGEELITILKKK